MDVYEGLACKTRKKGSLCWVLINLGPATSRNQHDYASLEAKLEEIEILGTTQEA